MAFTCPVNEAISLPDDDGTCAGIYCEGKYLYITGKQDYPETGTNWLSCHYPIELVSTDSELPTPIAQWDSETFSTEYWASRYNDETYGAIRYSPYERCFYKSSYNDSPSVFATSENVVNGGDAEYLHVDEVTIPQRTTIIAMMFIDMELTSTYGNPSVNLPTDNLDNGVGYYWDSGENKHISYWKFNPPPFGLTQDGWAELRVPTVPKAFVYYGYVQSRTDYVWMGAQYGGKAHIFEITFYPGYLTVSQLIKCLADLKAKYPALADVVWYNGADTAPEFPSTGGGGGGGGSSVDTYSVGPLKPNISTSFQLGANKVRADVKFKTGSISFQNHKVRTGYSLGAVKVQPIRSRSGNQMSTLGGGGGSSIQLPTPIAQWDADTFTPSYWASRYNDDDFGMRNYWDYDLQYHSDDPRHWAQRPTVVTYEGALGVKFWSTVYMDDWSTIFDPDINWPQSYEYKYYNYIYGHPTEREFTTAYNGSHKKTLIIVMQPLDRPLFHTSPYNFYSYMEVGLGLESHTNETELAWSQRTWSNDLPTLEGTGVFNTWPYIIPDEPNPIIYCVQFSGDVGEPGIQASEHATAIIFEMTLWNEALTLDQLNEYLRQLRQKYPFLADVGYNEVKDMVEPP